MIDLSIFIYILLFIIGIILNFISLDIAYKKFKVRKIPLWLAIRMAIFSNLLMLTILSIVTFHIGVYLIVNAIIPYAAIWRSDI
jgi:hypothetical protein